MKHIDETWNKITKDITKCQNESCPSSKICFRFMSIGSFIQSYSEYKPDETGKCFAFWPMSEKEINNDD